MYRRVSVPRFLHDDDEGFTLIELLIVIAILAILVSIVAINVTGIMDGVNSTAMSTEQSLVQLAIDRYNTWDVAVNGATAITAQGTPVKLPDGSAPFSEYLSTTTRYYYTWGADGTGLTVTASP
jgi:prepilin-type N-terminal cleavage/methylation domain-containing protein